MSFVEEPFSGQSANEPGEESPPDIHLNDDGRIFVQSPLEALATKELHDLCTKALKKIETFNYVSGQLVDECIKVNTRVNNLKLRAIGMYCNLENEEVSRQLKSEELELKVKELTRELEHSKRYNSSLEQLLKGQQLQIDTLNSLDDE